VSGQTIRTSGTKAEALQLQSSARGVLIPWVRGVTRVPANLCWYNGFKAIPHTETQGGKGGGVRQQSTTYTYVASMLMGLCHGPIIRIGSIWRGKAMAGGRLEGDVNAFTWPWVPSAVGSTVTLPNSPAVVGVVGVFSADGTMRIEGKDFKRVGLVFTLLNSAFAGQTLSIAALNSSTTWTSGALADFGLTLLSGELGQSVWSGFSGFSSESLAYSGLAALAGLDYDLGENANVENHNIEIVGPLAYHLGPYINDVDPALFVRELLLDARAGAGFPGEFMGTLQRWSDFCVSAGLLISPALMQQTTAADVVKTAADLTCSAISTSSGKLDIVPRADTAQTGNGRTYTPNLTPVYDLDDECYTPSGSGDSPVRYRLKSQSDRFNTWSLQFRNRAMAYAPDVADAQDAADIADRGVRANTSAVQADWICDPTAAAKAVQLMMQRSVSVLAEYDVPLPPHFSLIDLCDPLTLTDATLGMAQVPVLVIGIDEDDQGNLKLICEDYPIGAANAAAYSSPDSLGFLPNFNVAPGYVDTPAIFEGPAVDAGVTGLEVYIAARGLSANWGGCQVWTSLDGTNYRKIATINGPSRYGTLSASVTSSATSIGVSGLASGQLLSGTAGDAAQMVTLCCMRDLDGTDPEFFSHQGATLTGAGAYTLSDLVRGAYGSPSNAHDAGGMFVRIDDRVARSGQLDRSMIGQTLYVKFLSFNVYGAAMLGLADVSPYTYIITGGPANNGTVTSAGANLIPNSSFEFDSNANGAADGWTTYLAGTSGTITRTLQTGRVSGKSQRIAASGLGTTSSDRAGVYKDIAISPGALGELVLSGYLRGTTGSKARAYLNFYASGTHVGPSISSPVIMLDSSAWQRAVLDSGPVPASADTARVYFWTEARAGSTGSAYIDIDDSILTEGSSLSEWRPALNEALINTFNLVDGSATDSISTTLASDVYSLTTPASGFVARVLCLTTYTNISSQAVTLEISAFAGRQLHSNGPNPINAVSLLAYNLNSAGYVSGPGWVESHQATASTDAVWTENVTDSYVLSAGSTLQVTLTTQLSGPTPQAGTLTTTSPLIRITAIKK